MVVNFDHLHLSANSTSLPWYMSCFLSASSSIFFITFNITNILLHLPLCSFVIYLGLQQWRQQHSSTTSTISHSDSFTYHMVAIELAGVFGGTLSLCGVCNGHFHMLILGSCLLYFTWTGQMFFHTLTCLERYLAVVHPITYLSLRKERGIRIRNITNGCAWLLSILMTYVVIFVNLCWSLGLLIAVFIIIVFCSLSVLCVLTRSGPGEQVGGRGRVDQSKQRAFYIIMVILGMLLVKIAGSLIWVLPVMFTESMDCFTVLCAVSFNLPSTLVLPLLFIQRSGKLVCCKKNI